LTLGVVLTLGGVTGGRGQELSDSVVAASSPSWERFALPTLPENWSDLPFTLTASQNLTYNSNINAIPIGSPVASGLVLGDFTSTTNLGFSTKANVYGQQLYLDTTFGAIRYLHQVNFDSNIYSVSAGVNWTLTSRCAGNLGMTFVKSPAQITELVASGVNYVTTTSLAETGRCAVSNGYSLLFNSSLTDNSNSNPLDAVNNSRTAMIEAGIEYAKGPGVLTALARISDTSYSDRTAATEVLGLATEVDFHTFTLNYTRQINPNLSITGLVGLVGVTSGFTLGLPKSLLPIYTLSMSWAFSPKLVATASASRTVAPPTTVIANAEIAYSANVNLAYQVTPKVAATLGGAISYTNSAFTPGIAGSGLNPFLTGASNFYTVTAGLNYTMTPFLTAGLNASYTERVGNNLITTEDLVTVSLNYRPY
jgi:hypothetical protein